MVRRIYFLVLIFLLVTNDTRSRAVEPIGYFVDDSISIGLPFPYVLHAKYPENVDIMFPDSTYDYSPFEFVRKEVFPTSKDTVGLMDSAVYYLRTFEVDPSQALALPVFLLKKGDSIRVDADKDSAYLKEMIPVLSQEVSPKSSTSFEQVNKAFNYPYLVIFLVILGVIALVVFLVFGKRIRQNYKIKKLRKQYVIFSDAFARDISSLSKSKDLHAVEETLLSWKIYLEQLEKRAYTKLTTKEIGSFDLGETVTKALREVDRGIYRNKFEDDLVKSFETLEDIAQERYSIQLEKIKNA